VVLGYIKLTDAVMPNYNKLEKFAKLMEQTITELTRDIWYPKHEIKLKTEMYVDK